MPLEWNADFAHASPIFEPLRAASCGVAGPRWPRCEDLNRAFAQRVPRITNAQGEPIALVAPAVGPWFESGYEQRIYLQAEVQVRAADWHDLLNALVWLTFPHAKAALNARHYRELAQRRERGQLNRGRAQDALTLFDEGGVAVVASDPALTALLVRGAWKELFWQRRAHVERSLRFYVFGHALYEKALSPYVGMTGRCIVMEAAGDFLERPLAGQLPELDARLAAHIADARHLQAPAELPPLPVLGVPGWSGDNHDPAYYDNTAYFRPQPIRRR